MVRIYGDCLSGNCYKLKLVTELLGTPHAWKFVTWTDGGTRTADFLSNINPAGKVPVLETSKGEMIPESGAALYYLARDSHLWPSSESDRAQVLRWMFFEQYNHEPNVATLRFWLRFIGKSNLSEQQRALIPAKRIAGGDALALMNDHLQGREYFVADEPSLADISLFAYTHLAEEGGFGLENYPAICDWIDRIRALPGFMPMA